MPEEKEQPKGISRREFAKKIAQGMVAFLVVASVGKGYAGTCIDKTDTACTGSGTELDENCGSQIPKEGGKYEWDDDNHCGGTIGTSAHRDEDDDCGAGTSYNGSVYYKATDENCGSTYGPTDKHDEDSNCGDWLAKWDGGTYWDPDHGCSPSPNYDQDNNCGKPKPEPLGGTDTDNDGKS